jgi:hypothetical protein
MQQKGIDVTPDQTRRLPLASILLIAAFALAAMLSVLGNAPPAPRGAVAPTDAFSALRARDVLARILGDETPHPTGSAANAAVRDRVVAEFARLGLTADVQRRFACGTANCATVENIVARLPGASREQAVLLSAHYDSVAAGPGAADDGAGVAALIEVARALKAGPPLPRDVWLLVNDGEEIDLLGAEAFVREPAFANVASVINVEARGTTGASLLIETQPGNAAIVAAIGRALANPSANSLNYEIYKALPNDTDFTVYKREARSGVGFALAHGAARYHTPLDNLAQLDAGSLQHHGDNLLAMARELTAAQPVVKSDRDAVYFGLFGRKLVSWPADWNLGWLLLGLAAWMVLVVRLVRAKQVRPLALLGAGAILLALPVLTAVVGTGVLIGLGALGATPAAWTAQESSLVATFALMAVALLGVLATPLVRRFGAATIAVASLLPFALVAIATVLTVPGASYLGLLPLIVGALAGQAWPQRPALWAGLAAIVSALLMFPYVSILYVAVGHTGLSAAALVLALALLPLLPAWAGLGRGARWAGAVAMAGMVAFGTLAVMRPAFDHAVPRPVNLVYAGSGKQPRVFVDPFAELPAGFLPKAGFAEAAQTVLPWSQLELQPGRIGPALAVPRIDVVSDTVENGRRHVQVRLISARGAPEGGLRLPASVDFTSVRIDGQPLLPARHGAQAAAKFRAISRIGLPAQGVLVEFNAKAGMPIELFGVDSSPGLPAALADVVRARDGIGVPIHSGDTSVAWTRLALP